MVDKCGICVCVQAVQKYVLSEGVCVYALRDPTSFSLKYDSMFLKNSYTVETNKSACVVLLTFHRFFRCLHALQKVGSFVYAVEHFCILFDSKMNPATDDLERGMRCAGGR